MKIDVNVLSGSTDTSYDAFNGVVNTFSITPEAGKTVITMAIPMVDIHGFWHCNMNTSQLQLMWKVDFTSAFNRGMPYLAFFNLERQLTCAIATDNLIDDTAFSAKLNQQGCTYDITVIVTGNQPFTLTVDRRYEIGFQQSVAEWRKSVMPELPEFPAGAWEPVFCTWYAVHGEVTAKWIEGQMRKVKALGFSTLIVDDGWCYDESKRVTPETLLNWYNRIGDWEISEVKFPEFKEHVKRVQDVGLKYLLWVAPHFFGLDSELYRQHPEWTLGNFREGCSHLNIKCREAVDLISEKLVKLASDNNLDGLKIDFIDVVRPSAEDPIGRDNHVLVEKLSNGLRKNNPESLIEFRQGYATLSMLPYATQFRAGDVPFDWMMNFRRLVDLRVALGDGVPVHADPAYWSPDEYPVNVARHMMVMFLGVPMLSMDVNTMPAEHLAIVKFYLDLYREKQSLLNYGHWSIIFSSGNAGVAMVENENEMLAVLMDGSLLPKVGQASAGRKLTLLNVSADTLRLNECEAAPGDTAFLDSSEV